MIRRNADPHKGGYAYVPARAVTGFFRPGQDVQPLLQELIAAGFADDPIEVYTGLEGLKQLDPEGQHHGWWVRFMRSLTEMYTEEFGELVRAEETLKAGGSVVAVFTLKDEEKKKRAAQILKAHHGQGVMYWGPMLREYFLEREPAAARELNAALELDLRREEQEAVGYRMRADQAGELGLAELKVKLEEMAADEAGHARELRRLLKGT